MKRLHKGFGLVELMVALVLGVLVSGAAMQLLLTNQQTFALQDANSNMQDDGQMLLRYMMADLRQAGRGSAIAGTVDPVIFDTAQPAFSKEGGTGPDELVIRFFGTRDCQGGADINGADITNRYFVNGGVLSCSGSLSAGSVELMPRVENFQVQYGIDTTSDGVVSVGRWVNVADVGTSPVVAIRFAVLISSDREINVGSAASTHYVLDQVVTAPNDARLRKVFGSTVYIRNYNWDAV